MTQIEAFQRELENEAITTRKMLAAVPNEKLDWAPHPKSMKMRALATHIAELPTWIDMVFTTTELDFENNPYEHLHLDSTEEILAFFEKCQGEGGKSLEEAKAQGKEETLGDIWTLRSGEIIHSKEPKHDVIRMAMSQIIHHRAQLGVYLRLLDVPIPGSYGPSADEGF